MDSSDSECSSVYVSSSESVPVVRPPGRSKTPVKRATGTYTGKVFDLISAWNSKSQAQTVKAIIRPARKCLCDVCTAFSTLLAFVSLICLL